jgi:hypothetical protein
MDVGLDSTSPPSPDLDSLPLHPFLVRAIGAARSEGIRTVADLHGMGAYRFQMLDGVGLSVFREAVGLLASYGLRWSSDSRLAKEYAAVLQAAPPAADQQSD